MREVSEMAENESLDVTRARVNAYRGCGHPLVSIAQSLLAEVERLTRENADLLKQLRQQTKPFCTRCGKLFPKGK
jgi:hypothetical protein